MKYKIVNVCNEREENSRSFIVKFTWKVESHYEKSCLKILFYWRWFKENTITEGRRTNYDVMTKIIWRYDYRKMIMI